MAKKKKVIVTNTKTPRPTQSKLASNAKAAVKKGVPAEEMLFGKKNMYIILGGVGLMALGFVLMSGGHMPSADVWDPDLIYSSRRIVLAPMVILAGLGMQIYAIFAKK